MDAAAGEAAFVESSSYFDQFIQQEQAKCQGPPVPTPPSPSPKDLEPAQHFNFNVNIKNILHSVKIKSSCLRSKIQDPKQNCL